MINNRNKFRDNIPIIILFICVISIFLVKFTIVSLVISSLSLLFCFVFSRKNIRIFLATITISIATIITNGIILYNNYNDIDIFEDKNILVGTWSYNYDTSSYIFNDDNTFFQYNDTNDKDNYCTGTYRYSYGGTSKNGDIIKHDDTYYYYDLNLDIDYCFIDSEKDNVFIFGINKDDYNDLIFIDSKNNYAFKLKKIQD